MIYLKVYKLNCQIIEYLAIGNVTGIVTGNNTGKMSIARKLSVF